ncbi:hypothetical protein HAX54_033238, partial [Datura stramonium]|nr:hypothetical protein [Datura stramonium]
ICSCGSVVPLHFGISDILNLFGINFREALGGIGSCDTFLNPSTSKLSELPELVYSSIKFFLTLIQTNGQVLDTPYETH